MTREVTDDEGTTWTVVQAFAGVSESAAATRAAERSASREGHVAIVCTPSGGAQSVRTELPAGWEEDASDDAILAAIRSGRQATPGAER